MNSSTDTKKKILLIDGLTTIMNEKFFILDEIPRIMASYIEEGFTIWIAVREHEDVLRWENKEIVPDWMRENIILINDLEFENLPTLADQEDSMVITNQMDNPALYDVCGSVNDVKEVFHSDLFPIVNQADFLFCFGFSEDEFTKFCNQSNLIGILNDHVVRDNDTKNTIHGMAFWMDKDVSWSQNYKNAFEIVTLCLAEHRYIPKHNKKLLGVVYQGKEYEMAKESKIPLLYV
jgi:hypothetical protein